MFMYREQSIKMNMTILETVKDLHQNHYGDTLEVKCTQRNFREEDLKEEVYSRSKIIAWRKVYEEYDNKKDKCVAKNQWIFCNNYTPAI